MRQIAALPLFFWTAMSCVAASSVHVTQILEQVSRERPTVRWDASSLVSGDFNGDGKTDHALVGYIGKEVVLATRLHASRKKQQVQYLSFGVGPSMQSAICEVPAILELEEHDCMPIEDEPLPGCRSSKRAQALALRGGDCDSIHLYWNHKTNRMVWWRL